MPLYRRLPKRGFKNIFAKQYVAVNVEELNKLEDGAEVTAETLKANEMCIRDRFFCGVSPIHETGRQSMYT